MSSSKLASFAPYTPPPDHPEYQRERANLTNSYSQAASYQSGAVPTSDTSYSNIPTGVEGEASQTQWETTHGFRVDALAAFSYLLGPVSALLLLITETRNDYVRFHAYQSALVTSPMLLLRMLASLMGFSRFGTSLTVAIIVLQTYLAVRAYLDASRNILSTFLVPYVGPLAQTWVDAE